LFQVGIDHQRDVFRVEADLRQRRRQTAGVVHRIDRWLPRIGVVIDHQRHAVAGACWNATTEEVGVLGPDRATERKSGRENWPVLRIARPKPPLRLLLVFTVHVRADQLDKPHHRVEQAKCLRRIASVPDDKCGQVLVRARQSQFGDEEGYIVGVAFGDLADPNAKSARMRMLASSTSALFGIPLLRARGLPDFLILPHEFVFGGAP